MNLSACIGDKNERPLHVRQLERSYEFGIGDYTVDLTDVALPPGTTRVDVALGIGDLLVGSRSTPRSRFGRMPTAVR